MNGRTNDQTTYNQNLFNKALRALRRAAAPLRTRHPIAAAIVAAHLVAMSAQAVQLQIQIGRPEARSSQAGGEAAALGALTHGTIVDVPDRYFKDESGRMLSPETAIMRWLSYAEAEGPRAAHAPRECEGNACSYFPAKLVQLGEGSTVPRSRIGTEVLIPLQHLVRNHHVFVVGESTTAYEALPARPAAASENLRAGDEAVPASGSGAKPAPAAAQAEAAQRNSGSPRASTGSQMQMGCVDGRCRPELQGGGAGLNAMLTALAPALHGLGMNALTASGPAPRSTPRNFVSDAVRRNFEATCGTSFSDWSSAVRREAARRQIPEDILFGLMNQESTGRCSATGLSGEIGMMQIKPSTSTLAACRSGRSSECERALRDPYVALDQAIQILERNRSFVMQPMMVAGGGRLPRVVAQGFPYDTPLRTQWRLAVLSYNQGPYYAARAKAYMDDYNARSGAGLRAQVWNEVRPFILHTLLDGSNSAERNRAWRGLAYAESVVPYSSAGS